MSAFDERGLLGLAFHPDYATNGRFIVYYSAPLRAGAPAGFNHTSHISEFRVSGDPNRADPGSERILLQVDKPQFNHNGGTVLFGPDGLLYIAIGDGGGANDVGLGHVEDWYAVNEGGNGQDVTQNLLGNILRIDVDSGDRLEPRVRGSERNPLRGEHPEEGPVADAGAAGDEQPLRADRPLRTRFWPGLLGRGLRPGHQEHRTHRHHRKGVQDRATERLGHLAPIPSLLTKLTTGGVA